MNAPPTTSIYTLSLHDALPISLAYGPKGVRVNALALGSITTDPMEAVSAEERRTLADEPALKRWGSPEEVARVVSFLDRKSTRLNSSHQIISYAVFCLKKKK